ncbi:MAG: hypothetical protein D6681_09345, partial [Calditrichaeota bacterium]
MSIARELGEDRTLTGRQRELDLFTDRHEAIKQFCRYLHATPTPKKILFFHGAGGNGKTLLLAKLRQRFCWHFPNDVWGSMKDLEGENFLQRFI